MTTESRLINGTPVIIIQNEDGDGDPPRPPYLAMVIGYDEDWDRYEIQLVGQTGNWLSEPADTVHPVGELLVPAVRAEVRDWNAKVTWQAISPHGGEWVADCENSRGMSYRGTWQTSLDNYGEPVKVLVTQEG